ncbi:MAG: hypothetical protein JWO86_2901 [Myxococcaceae bacterium]|nr:hypothetical protein [Myxococcaceae bacterium]
MLTFVSLKSAVVMTAAAAVVLVAAAGCGAVAPVATFETHEASASALSACAPSGAAICERASTCSPFWFDRIYTSVSTCAAVFTERCVDRYRGEGAATTIADCAAAVTSLSCDAFLDPVLTFLDPSVLLSWCPVTPGVFAAGDRCLRDGDCTTGNCAWHHGTGCGICDPPIAVTALPKDGEACSSSDMCASRWCSAGGTCAPTAKLGEPCADRPCDLLGGLTCGSDSLCRFFGTVPLGQACMSGDYCVAGARCVHDKNDNGTCKPWPSAGVGEDCTAGCARELTCTLGKCVAPTPGLWKSCDPPTTAQ